MTILGIIVLAAALAAPAGAQQKQRAQPEAPKAQPDAPKAEQSSPDPETDGASGGPCGNILVSSPQTERRRRGTFSASKTLDLTLTMRPRNTADAPALVIFRVVTPRGHLYQEIPAVHRPQGDRRRSTLSATLPVAGTAIPTNSLYGSWRIAPYLDGSSEPCAPATVFTILE